MKMQKTGYIKLHRRFLTSQVRKLNSATVCLFVDLLLLADQNGQIITSLTELQKVLGIGSKHTILDALKQLEKVSAVSVVRKPFLQITVPNFSVYQARSCGAKNAPGVVQKMHRSGAENAPAQIHKVPVHYLNFKNNKNIFIYKKLNFQNPQTDLEKLALFYLKGTDHPGLKKVNNNEILNAAVRMDLPHFETVLANCRDLEQAKACVAHYVRQAKGTYSMYYLACQINSIRQEVESKEYKRG
nr:MAG TPA_asm: replisome organizer [Caudoviricetes sp.]